MGISAKNMFHARRIRSSKYWFLSKLVFFVTWYAVLQSFFERKDFDISKHVQINAKEPPQPSIIFFRIIGNSLPPLHSNDQSVSNLKFVIENENRIDSVKKVWILNRIIDPLIIQELTESIEKAGDTYFIFIFNPDKFLEVDYNHPYVSKDIIDVISGQTKVETMTSPIKSNISYYFLNKNLYLMNNNGARNFALQLGIRLGYTWILPWDGNCYVTDNTWPSIIGGLRYLGQKHKYFLSYMIRVTDNDQTGINKVERSEAAEEPQIIFRRDAQERFDDMIPYGRRSKVALLIRLKIEGDWNDWRWYDWERNINPHYSYSNDSTNPTPKAGFIIRLSSGANNILISSSSRFNVRLIAIASFIIRRDIELFQIRFRKVDGLKRQALSLEGPEFQRPMTYEFYHARGLANSNISHMAELVACLEEKPKKIFNDYIKGVKSRESVVVELQTYLDRTLFSAFMNVLHKMSTGTTNIRCMEFISLPALLEVINVFTLSSSVRPKYRVFFKIFDFLRGNCQKKNHSILSKASVSLVMLSISKYYPDLKESGKNFWLTKLYASLLGSPSRKEFSAIRQDSHQSEIFVKYVVSLAFICLRYDVHFGQLTTLLELSTLLCDHHLGKPDSKFECWLKHTRLHTNFNP